MKKMTVSALSLMIALAAGAAFAAEEHAPPAKGDKPPHEGGQHHGKMFKKTDTNSDGAIGKDEWEAKGDKMFKEMDANGDGKITQDEMKSHHEKKREEWKEKREERKEKMGDVKGDHPGHHGDKKAPEAPAKH